MRAKKFYSKGLHFSCTRCSACCRHDPGFVFLSRPDADALASCLQMDYSSFVAAYCRWIPSGGGVELLSLRERSNYDCVFWGEGGCSVYGARPLQCRTFPFWDSVVENPDAWAATAAGCPGMNRGELHGADEIERALDLRDADPVVSRSV